MTKNLSEPFLRHSSPVRIQPNIEMRPADAPKYDAPTVLVNCKGIGIFFSDWKKEAIQWVSDKYGSIAEEYWDEAIQQHSNYIVSCH